MDIKNVIIDLRRVSIRYDQGPYVLQNIDLQLERGSFHYVTGKSGAGKTSLLSLLYLAQRPSGGALRVFGNNLKSATRDDLALFRRKIGVVFQDFLTQGDFRIVGISAEIIDTAYRIDGVWTGGRRVVLIGMQYQREVHLVGTLNGVSTIGDKVLVETIVATIDEELRNPGAFVIQIAGIEHHPFLQHTL